ncbi:hypothetical protein AVEN_65255-1 [Araneus ventricosus]|uniref:Uncharacterized protein n=1 Tax=Araneus ventricosus TaxID=182803 RepID=A0A4Y2AHH5_ARAVE|nr:hypothetical protein AVEN_65255-1 [Araneus ventricosus]
MRLGYLSEETGGISGETGPHLCFAKRKTKETFISQPYYTEKFCATAHIGLLAFDECWLRAQSEDRSHNLLSSIHIPQSCHA